MDISSIPFIITLKQLELKQLEFLIICPTLNFSNLFLFLRQLKTSCQLII